ncbi:phage tail tube protein [Suttonella ornithocola]|uniref:Phage tail protein n=1 Tax=Suttonella ornithocola TaxID=279832 RepID=A0A380MSV5_9GAMM|nr:phage tail tube protein [Suttonella ornithocola]SUO95264.1 Uncharacterised protein [Suttonella ornithocola]
MATKKKVLLSNGTEVFIVDPTNDTKVYKLCVTQLDVNEGDPTKIDVTTLCEREKIQEVDGLLGSSESTFTINMDFSDETHKMLLAARKDKRELKFRIGQSDGDAQATHSSSGWGEETSRTWVDFTGYISKVPLSYSVNAVVQPQVSVTMTSGYSVTHKA